jgi:cell division protease FtsH
MSDPINQPPPQPPQPQQPPEPGINWNRILLFMLIWLGLVWIFNGLFGNIITPPMSYTDFKEKVTNDQVEKITISGDRITGTLKKEAAGKGSPDFNTVVPAIIHDPQLMPLLESHKVAIEANSTQGSFWGAIIISMLPWLLIIGFFVYSSSKMKGRFGDLANPFTFGKSKAKLYEKKEVQVTFEDVAGLENPKMELMEVIDFLKNPGKYQAMGGYLPKGVLLIGPPGNGKTLMARATAGEAGVPFFSISGSEFIEMFVGVGASRVRDMFANAKKDAPAIIFIDEIDSIGRARGTGLGGGHDEREQTLNQILSEMDGFSANESIIVMAATNRPDVLDPALIRPGRFDRQITMDLPHRQARQEILTLHARHVPLGDDVDLAVIAKQTVGFSGADLKNLVNEAALNAARLDKKEVSAEDFQQGRDKITMGLRREERITDEEKKTIAYHEAGHALAALRLTGTDPLEKVTIVPRGQSLGATEQLPREDRHNLSKSYLTKRLAVMIGGHAAEKLVFDDITSGAGDDLKKATELARRMVCQWGMSETLGPVAFRQGELHPFLGRELAEPRDFSENTARLIDEEVRRLVSEAEAEAEKVLTEYRGQLDTLAEALLEHESLNAEEVDALFAPDQKSGSV